MKKLIAACLLIAALSAGAQEVTIKDIGATRYAALESLAAKENARRSQALTDLNAERFAVLARINVQRDAKLPKLTAVEAGLVPACAAPACTAEEAGLSPVSVADVLVSLSASALDKEATAIAEATAATTLRAKVEAIDAIKAKASDCSDKATAAGLDPVKVCK